MCVNLLTIKSADLNISMTGMFHWLFVSCRVKQEIQTTLRDEIKSMCEYRPYEHCDYPARMAAEISVKKLDCVLGQIAAMQGTVAQYQSANP